MSPLLTALALSLVGCAKSPAAHQLTLSGHRLSVEIADEPAERSRGLMHRASMDANAGMLFIYPTEAPRSFWMENTSIPLSIAYIDLTGRILNIENMTPFDRRGVPSAGPAVYALEVNQGWFEGHGVKQGTRVEGAWCE